MSLIGIKQLGRQEGIRVFDNISDVFVFFGGFFHGSGPGKVDLHGACQAA